MTRLMRVLLMVFAVTWLSVSTSSVQAEAPSAKDRAQARELYAMGQQQFRQGNFGAAQRSFEDAYRSVPNPIVLLSIAECQVRSESFAAALVTLERYLAERPEAPDKTQVQEQIRLLQAKPGLLTVESSPTGGAIWLDGQDTAQVTPATLEVAAGEHLVAVEAEGHTKAEQRVSVQIGAQQGVNLSLLPVAVPQEEPESEGSASEADLRASTTSQSKLPLWIATGVTGAGLITGAVLGGLALKHKSDYDSNPTEALADKGERLALFADVGFGVAAAAGITAIVLYVTRDKDSDKKTQAWSLNPSVAKNNVGFSGRLQF